ncbi:hypothetical protein Tco_0782395 [Tanacetum coccineum]
MRILSFGAFVFDQLACGLEGVIVRFSLAIVDLFEAASRMAEYTLRHLKPGDKNKTLEAKVYRKWIDWNVSKPTPNLHLSASPATHYYLNPDTPETERSRVNLFSPSVDAISGHACSELVQKLDTTDSEQVVSEVLENKRKRRKFQFHFNTSSKLGATDLILDDMLDEAANNDGTIKL